MKLRGPKPVVLEPACVGLLRLGREMGAGDVPAAELVRDSILSAEVSREVDRLIDDADRKFWDQVDDDCRRGVTLSKRCMSCGAVCAVFGVKHADDCDLDRSLTAEQRYALRNPDRGTGGRWFRKLRIRCRWAIINGRCGQCVTAAAAPGRKHCGACLKAACDRNAAGRAEAARAA